MLYDGHAHIGDRREREIRLQKEIMTFVCGTNPVEASSVKEAAKSNPFLIPTYGLHPWYSDQYKPEEMLPFLLEGQLIGEIGMDSVWCNVPLSRQREIFMWQLELANHRNVPVILHTKGQEKEVFDCIKFCHIPILVHWYSSGQYLEQYKKKGCYFTIGPDAGRNQRVQDLIAEVDIDHLLIETDGYEACKWALGDNFKVEKIERILEQSISYISEIKKMGRSEVYNQLEKNFIFLQNFKR